jgi:hypothetical protein
MWNDRRQGGGAFEQEETVGGRGFPELDPGFFMGMGTRADERRETSEHVSRPAKPKRRSFRIVLNFVFGGPINAFNAANIAEGASTIEDLAMRIRRGPGADPRVRVRDDRTLDLQAMALKAGVSIADIEVLLWNKRRQTKRAVFCYAFGAISFFGLWLWEALSTPTYARLSYVIVLLTICGLFVLSAFYNTLLNWQIRTLRLGTWREFLSAEESWWPS